MGRRVITDGNKGVFKDVVINHNKTEVRSSSVAGYGVFATKDIKKGEIIEEAVIFAIKPLASRHLETLHGRYVFNGEPWPRLIGGNISFYNHSTNPNMNIVQDNDYERIVKVIALKDIKKDSELLHDYGYDPSNM